jgi:hypothetical protein
VQLSGLRPSQLDTGTRPLTEAEIGFQRQRSAMAHQRTLVSGMREPLGSTKDKEGAMSAVVGIDVGAYKHAAAGLQGRKTGSRARRVAALPTGLGSTSWTAGSSGRAR